LRDILRIQWVWKTVKKAEKGRERDRRKKEKRNGLIDWFMIKKQFEERVQDKAYSRSPDFFRLFTAGFEVPREFPVLRSGTAAGLPTRRVLGGEWDTPRLGGGLGAGSSVCIGAESERARGEAEKGGAAGKERVEGAKTSDDGRERVGGGDLLEGDIAPP
jgi:hypothetical protein